MEDLDINKLLYDVAQGQKVPLPSGSVASIREMTGHDQRKFMNKATLSNGTAINSLLANCTETIDELTLGEDDKAKTQTILDMLEGDRQTLLFSIRRYSLGDDFSFTMDCPHCKKRQTWEVSLKDEAFALIPYPNGKLKVIEYESKVRPGLHIKVKLLDGVASMSVLKRLDTADLLTDLEVRQPQVKNGENWQGIQLNRVPDSVISEMRHKLREAEGRLDSRVTVFCKSCTEPATFDLLQVPDFMIPNVTY